MSKPGFLFYFDWKHILQSLTDAERGALVMALLTYAETGQRPQFDDRVMAMAWNALWPRLDEDAKRYETMVHTRREAAGKRWDKQKAAAQDMDKHLNW